MKLIMQSQHGVDSNSILDRLKEYMKIKTDSELAKLLNLTQQTISAWRGRNSLDIFKIISICDCDLNWLIKGVGDAQQNVVSSTSKTNFDNLDEVIRLGRENKKLKESLSSRMINSGIRKLEAEIEVLKIRLEERDRLIDKFITGKEITSKPINRKSINLSSQSLNEHTKSVPCGD